MDADVSVFHVVWGDFKIMTFACKNYNFGDDTCGKLHGQCLPGRPGCVLEGRVAISEELQKKIDILAEERKERISQKKE